MQRNKSMVGRKPNNSSAVIVDMPNLQERESFHKNHSLLVNKKELREINSQLGRIKEEISTVPLRPSTTPEPVMTPEEREWNQGVNRFRQWKPSYQSFSEMSALFENMVRLVMREEVEMSDLHKQLLLKEESHHREMVGLYNEAQTDQKNNQEMHEYAGRLQKFLDSRIAALSQLRSRAAQYQNHITQHEYCEGRLMEAGTALGQPAPIW